MGLDTNVLVRYLVGDDAKQSAVAREVMAGLSQDNPGYLTSVVLAELSWVLARAYKEPRERIADGIEGLLRSNDLTIENRDASFRALAIYRAGKSVDFADALIAMASALAGANETVTFDRKAALEGHMRLLVTAWRRFPFTSSRCSKWATRSVAARRIRLSAPTRASSAAQR